MKKVFLCIAVLVISKADGQTNTPTGTSALASVTTGTHNTATGYESLFSNTTGSYNSAHGAWTLYSNTTGYNNSAYGVYSLYNNTTGNDNTAMGYRSLYNATSSHYNTAFGTESLFNITSGSTFNVALGYRSFFNPATLQYCVAAGAFAGNNSGQTANTFIGAYADANSTGYNNATAIGYNAIVTSSNSMRLGDNNITYIGGAYAWSTGSDRRIKKNIRENVPGLEFIRLLKPVSYQLDISKADAIMQPVRKLADGTSVKLPEQVKKTAPRMYSGFIAQDVETAAQSIHFDFSGVDRPQHADGIYGLRYEQFVVPLVKAGQELSASCDELQAEITQLITEIDVAIRELKTIRSDQPQRQITIENKGAVLGSTKPKQQVRR
jgi:hypothetical protein